MNIIYAKVPCLILALISTLFITKEAHSQLIEHENDPVTNTVLYELTVSPAAEPDPAFKYRLQKTKRELKPGNGASFYYRAHLLTDNNWRNWQKKFPGVDQWYGNSDLPLSKLPVKEVKKFLGDYFNRSPYEALKAATSRTFCDWNWDVQDIRGPKLYAFLLPEIQKARTLERTLHLRIRVAVLEKRYADAIEDLTISYRLGKDVSNNTFLVGSLVGIAIDGIANSNALELIAAPDSPNLYWAYAELPDPMIDILPTVKFELGFGKQVFDVINDPKSKNYSAERWAEELSNAYVSLLNDLAGIPDLKNALPKERPFKQIDDTTLARFIGLGSGLVSYKMAKDELIKRGHSKEDVEAMPVGKVIAMQASFAYQHSADELMKIFLVPFSESKAFGKKINQRLREEGYLGRQVPSKEIIPIASLLLPAVRATRTAQERLRRDMKSLMVIEALRMHAAKTGEFPETLAEITVVPVPKNPATGKPFQYHLESGKAILELPKSDGFYSTKRYEITLRKE